MVDQFTPIIEIKRHLVKELNDNISGLNFRSVRLPSPPTGVSETQVQVYLDEEEFEAFGFNRRYKSTATIFIDIYHPGVDPEEDVSPAIEVGQKIKRFIQVIVNKVPPNLGDNAAWIQMIVRRIEYQSPWKEIKLMDFMRLELEIEYSEIIQQEVKS